MTKHTTIAQEIHIHILADAGHGNYHVTEIMSLRYRQVGKEKKYEWKKKLTVVGKTH